jgi:hypothetical protein
MPRKNKRPIIKKKTMNKFRNTSYEYILKGGGGDSFIPPKAAPPENPSWADPRAHQKCPKCKGWIRQGQDKSSVCSQSECKFCPICKEEEPQVAASPPSVDTSQTDVSQSTTTGINPLSTKSHHPKIPTDTSTVTTQPSTPSSEDNPQPATTEPVLASSSAEIAPPQPSSSESNHQAQEIAPVVTTQTEPPSSESVPTVSTTSSIETQSLDLTPSEIEPIPSSASNLPALSDPDCGKYTGNKENCGKNENCGYVEKSNKWASQGECLLKTHKYFDNLSNDSVYGDDEKNEEFLDKLIIKLNFLLGL